MPDLATRFAALVTFVDTTPKDDLEKLLAERPGGVAAALDTVYEKLASTFNPAKAGGEKGTFQYEVATAEGTKEYYLHVAGTGCGAPGGGGGAPGPPTGGPASMVSAWCTA
ncbi:hypothetical protein ACWDAZ_39945, partial [Streptomyces sp. NPDC001215]